MDIKALFEGKQLPTVKEELGVMSIDTIERLWTVLKELPENRIILISKDHKAALIGKMAIREDGKFCVAIQFKGQIQNNQLTDSEIWHVNVVDETALYREFWEVLHECQLV